MFEIHSMPLDRPFATSLAQRLASWYAGELPSTMLVLPSVRAGGTLAHALLDTAERDAVLLPTITTPSRLVETLADRMPPLQRPHVADSARELILTTELTRVSWLKDRQESAPGLAVELLGLFDDLRLHGRSPEDPCPLAAGAADKLREDRDRVVEAWRLYRQRVPHDIVDRILEVVAAAGDADDWVGPQFRHLVIAGFASSNPTWAALLDRAAAQADSARLVIAACDPDDRLSQGFLATYRHLGAATAPLSPQRRVQSLLSALDPETPPPDDRPLVSRLAEIGQPDELANLANRPTLFPCPDPESESHTIASLVIARLERDPAARICVATNDRSLARRVAQQLRDAGLPDLDDTSGQPLSGEPEGLLFWSLLRCVVTGLSHEPLLELLTNPLVTFGRERGLHRKRTLRFERELLRGRLAGMGLEGYRTRAREKDAAFTTGGAPASREMEDLVDDLERTLEHLLNRREPTAVAELVTMLRDAWSAAAPTAALEDAGATGDDRTAAARRSLHTLLEELAASSNHLPRLRTADFAAAMGRLVAKVQVMPRRSPFLPVHVTGLIEARLEHHDLLILCGMDEDHVPGRLERPLFLGQTGRSSAGLPGWRETMGLQAELFLRLLHGGDETVITWPAEREGRPVMPSPFVTRLGMVCGPGTPAKEPLPLYRHTVSERDPARRQAAFRQEVRPTTAAVAPRLPKALSHGAIRTYLDCPYRYLLERGFGLREQDDVIERLQKKDSGEIVHACLARFLAPGGPGRNLLKNSDHAGALSLLREIAQSVFSTQAAGLPQRHLWLATFLRSAAELIDVEISRAGAWEPVAVEAEFKFTLTDLHAWLDDAGIEAPAPEVAALQIVGRIDRVDLSLADPARRDYAVVDYKTGAVPSRKAIADGEDLQLSIYALAVEIGAVADLPEAGEVIAGAFYPVRPGRVGPDGPHFPAVADLRRDAAAILAACTAVVGPNPAYPRVPHATEERDPAACRFCGVAGVCRRDERMAAAGLEATT